jgi:hypothetical protein
MSRDDDPLSRVSLLDAPIVRPGVSEAIHRHCTEGLASARGLDVKWRLALSALVLIGVAAWLAVGGETAHDTRAALFGALGWGVVLFGALCVGLGKPPGRRVRRERRALLALLLPLGFLAYLLLDSSVRLPFVEFLRGPVEMAARCGINALLGSTLGTGVILWLWRRTDPMSPEVSGALIGLVAGIAGAVGIGIGCSNDEAWHLLAGHGLGVIALSVAGAWLGRRWLAP